MKALIRNPGETVTEADSIPGIDWTNGMPLTNPEWAGGSYTLVADYVPPAVPPADTSPETYTVPPTAAQTETVTDEETSEATDEGTDEATGEATDEGTDEGTAEATATVTTDAASGVTFTDDEGRTYTLDEIRQMIGLSD